MEGGERDFLRRWIVDPVLAQFTQGITTEKIALSVAVGSLCAFFPVLGAATPLCILAGVVLRLNQPIIQAVNGLSFALYIPVVLGFTRIGELALGRQPFNPDLMLAAGLLWHHPAIFVGQFGGLVVRATLGWAAMAPIWLPLGYALSLLALRRLSAASAKHFPVQRPVLDGLQ